MSSIHDVAAMAGVSTATVSKHINKTGYVSPEKREAIDAAIRALDYRPNRSARMLKTNLSRDILIVLPNMAEKLYRDMTESATKLFDPDYRVILQLTNDSPELESRILEDCLNNPCAGLLLVSCRPDNTHLLGRVSQSVPTVFLMRRPVGLENYSYIGFNHYETVYEMTRELLQLGYRDMALFTGDRSLSSEQDCIRALETAFRDAGSALPEHSVFSSAFNRESLFRQLMTIFTAGSYPRVILCTSPLIAQTVVNVSSFLKLRIGCDLLILSLGEGSWYSPVYVNNSIYTVRDACRLGNEAAAALLDHIRTPAIYEDVVLQLSDLFDFGSLKSCIDGLKRDAQPAPVTSVRGRLRILMKEEDASTHALKSLLPLYARVANADVEMVTLSHDDVLHAIERVTLTGEAEYDLYSVDAPWVPYLASIGALADISSGIAKSGIPSRLLPNIIEKLCLYNGRVYGLPYIHSLQLLFYRRDVFEDPAIAAAFRQRYSVNLEPPQDWNMFNIVADFLTGLRRENPDAPYGTCLCGIDVPHLCTKIYPRLWAYNGSIIDARGHVRLYSPENLRAYRSLIELAEAMPRDTFLYGPFDGLKLLGERKIAMCTAFSNNAAILKLENGCDPSAIGFAPIPGRKPVIAGWNLCINPRTRRFLQAWDFLKWFSGVQIVPAYSVMGGCAPMSGILEQESLLKLFPWNRLAAQEYHTGIHRECPPFEGAKQLNQPQIEQILANVVYRCLDGRTNLDNALRRAHRELSAYAESNGYPKSAWDGKH